MMQMMGMHTAQNNMMNRGQDYGNTSSNSNNMGMSMDDMMGGLQGKTGDDFDKAFLSEMIMHHQGAIDMAKEARTNAKHEEIKSLANNIITAQAKEIEQMKQWQHDWGY